MNLIKPGQTIGILGGGQLGKMMAQSAKAMGFRVIVLDPKPASPCAQVADGQIVAQYDDMEAAKQLAEVADVITYEFENVDADVAAYLETEANLPQGSRLLQVTSNRIEEKKAVLKAGGRVTPFYEVTDIESLETGLQEIGFPSVLKTVSGGYDGKGQDVLREMSDAEAVKDKVAQGGVFILEQFVDFTKEISVIVSRSTTGETTVFPVAENIHERNILHHTIAPARVSDDEQKSAVDAALNLADVLKLVGTFAVEFFVTSAGDVIVNELAPRPHNSGHYTIEACETSQFEQHIRGICGWPLGSVELLKPAVMVNVLGEHMEQTLKSIPDFGSAHVHLYGKDAAKTGRKMGHINFLGQDAATALKTADALGIWANLGVEETV